MAILSDTVRICDSHSTTRLACAPLHIEGTDDPRSREFLDIFAQQKLTAVYQPIVDVSRAGIYGYEALIRGPKGSNFESPQQLFTAATALDLDRDFEILCRRVVIQRFAEMKLGNHLFINVSPALLLSREHQNSITLGLLEEFAIDPQKIVIEVTEHHNTRQYADLNHALNHYRNLGFKVALDDIGSGYSTLRLWTELLPDFIKIDKHFVRNVHQSKIKQSFIRGLMEISSGSNCRLISEGVETREEFEFLSAIGVNLQQGFYFAMPAPIPPESIARELLHTDTRVHLTIGSSQNNLRSITSRMDPIAATTTVRVVLDTLQRHPEVMLLPISDGGQAVGLVERYVFQNSLMSSLYGLELYGKMRIIDYLKERPVLVDINTALEDASFSVTSRTNTQAFIVTENGRYYGVSTVLELLHQITEQQICSARYANPLTLLPGIQPTNDAIARLQYSGTRFTVAYFDLDNFKPYNDHYGYDAGDKVIKRLADILRGIYKKEFSLIGHIGGDDFVVVDMSREAVENCKNVLDEIKSAIPDFYRGEHVVAGGIHGTDRLGNACFFPLLSLSIGIVPPECAATCESHVQIADLATQAKKIAKKIEGNSLFVNRRCV